MKQVSKPLSDKLFPSLQRSSLFLLVMVTLATTCFSPWTLVAALYLMDFITYGISSLLLCTWHICLICKTRSRCTSTRHILMSVDVSTIQLNSLQLVLLPKREPKKSKLISLHVMKHLWFSKVVLTRMGSTIQLPTATNERLPHEWAKIIFLSPSELCLYEKTSTSKIYMILKYSLIRKINLRRTYITSTYII